jgi:CubicO group peptidase (beta-lactamase class C family)
MKKALSLIFSIVFVQAAIAQDTDGARYEKIDSLLNYFFNNGKLMGSITIREKDQVVFQGSYGFADIQAKTKATPDTKYKIGQATEMFTAAIIFQLIEEKKLKLTTKLSEYFPKMPNAEAITIGQMLDHTSGIADYTKSADFASYQYELQNRKAMTDRLSEATPAFAPGERAEYSAGNYLLLGYIIQDITKKSFKESVAGRIVNKAQLKNTYGFGKINPKKKEAYSYIYKNGNWDKAPEWHESVSGGAAGLQSTPTDMTRFMRALFTGKIIKPESLKLMTESETGNGMGVFFYPFAERRYVGHTGTIDGFTSVVCYYPKEDLSFSILMNAKNIETVDVITGVLSIYYKLPYRFPTFIFFAIDEALLKSYEGDYATPNLPFTINVKPVDGKLRVHADEQGTFYITPISNTSFTHDAAGIIMDFTPNSFTLKQNGESTVFTRQ